MLPSVSDRHAIIPIKMKQALSYSCLTLIFSALSHAFEGYIVKRYPYYSIARTTPGRFLWRFYIGYFYNRFFILRIGIAGTCSSLVFARFSGSTPISATKMFCGSAILQLSLAHFQRPKRESVPAVAVPQKTERTPLEVVRKVFALPDLFFKIFKDCKGGELFKLPAVCKEWYLSFHSTLMLKHLFGKQRLPIAQAYQFLHHPFIVPRREGQLGEGMFLNVRLDTVEDIQKLRQLVVRYPRLEKLHLVSYLQTNEGPLLKEVFELLTEVIDFEAEEKDLSEESAITLPPGVLTLQNPHAFAKLQVLRLRSNGLSDADLRSIFNRALSLEQVDLSASDTITGECFVDLSPNALQRLRNVKCSWITNLNDRGLHALFARALLLETMSLYHCERVVGTCLRELPSTNLKEFQLENMRISEGLRDVWEKAKKLEVLGIDFGGTVLDVEGISTLPRLRALTFHRGGFFVEADPESERQFKDLLVKLTELRSLKFRCNLETAGQIYHFDHAGPLSKVENLHIVNTKNLTDRGLSNLLNQMKSLRRLTLDRCPELKGEELVLDPMSPWALDRLEICNQDALTDTFVLRCLSKISSLRELKVASVPKVSGSFVVMKDKLSQLRVLEWGINPKIPNHNLNKLLNCISQLRKLTIISGVVDATTFQLDAPLALTNLTTFSLSCWPGSLSDADLKEVFKRAKKLKTIVMMFISVNVVINGECFDAIDSKTAAGIRGFALSYLWGLNDENMKRFFSQLTNLQHLTIGDCPTLTAACLPRDTKGAFSRLKTFRHYRRMEPSILQEMIAFIKQRAPYCDIEAG